MYGAKYHIFHISHHFWSMYFMSHHFFSPKNIRPFLCIVPKESLPLHLLVKKNSLPIRHLTFISTKMLMRLFPTKEMYKWGKYNIHNILTKRTPMLVDRLIAFASFFWNWWIPMRSSFVCCDRFFMTLFGCTLTLFKMYLSDTTHRYKWATHCVNETPD